MTPMRRRDFVKAIVAVPVAAKTMLGQRTGAPQTPGTTTAPQTSGMGAAPQTPGTTAASPASGTAAPPPAAATTAHEIAGRQSLGFKAPPIASVVPDAVAETESKFFGEQQMATLRKLCEILMPPLNGYPGATQAGTPEFIDFLIGASPVDRQQMYQGGLDRLNNQAKKQFGLPFEQVNATQADQLLRPLLATWITDHPPTEPFMHFINVAHRDIRTATMNSQAWSVAAIATGERAPGVGLYWSPIDPDIEMYV